MSVKNDCDDRYHIEKKKSIKGRLSLKKKYSLQRYFFHTSLERQIFRSSVRKFQFLFPFFFFARECSIIFLEVSKVFQNCPFYL